MADRKISDLTALTAPAAGDYLPIVDISEVAAASKNKRITIEELFRGVPLGTAAAPSIAIEGDENTGIYSPGADQLAISTGGTGRVFVGADGKVTVGNSAITVADGAMIGAASSTGARLKLCDSDLGVTATDGFELFVADGGDAYIWQRENNPLLIGTNGTERMRITSAGNVGIGTTSPSELLDVSGTAKASQFKSAGGAGATGYDFSASGSGAGVANVFCPSGFTLGFGTNSQERARIDSSGRLLVGTSSTASAGGSQYAKLQVKGNTFSDSGGGVISVLSGTTTPASGVSVGAVLFAGTTGNEFGRIECIADAATGASDYPGRLVFSTTADGAASSTERMRITSDGYVRLASGTGGIQFNGDTAAANALDDYEEGTFTPTILQGITSPVYNAGNTRGNYRVIGRQVFFSLRVTLTGGTADANQLRVGGLPFNPALSAEFRVIHVGLFQTGASSTPVHAVGYNSTAYMDIVDSSDRTIVTGNEATNVLDLQITGAFPI